MNASVGAPVQRGWQAFGSEGQLIGRVDAVFADYLLVRTTGLLPVDLYVPMDALVGASNGRVILRSRAHAAYERWHRPLKRAPHA